VLMAKHVKETSPKPGAATYFRRDGHQVAFLISGELYEEQERHRRRSRSRRSYSLSIALSCKARMAPI
jgi:hypothetical protein